MKIKNASNERIRISLAEREGFDTEEPFDLDPGEVDELCHLEDGDNNGDGADEISISIVSKRRKKK